MHLDEAKLESLLMDIDEEASLAYYDDDERAYAIIVGGSAMILRRATSRPATHDIDILDADRRMWPVFSEYSDVNGHVAAFGDAVPYNFEDRLVKLPLQTDFVDYYTPSLEDLVVMKLYGGRGNDWADIESEETLSQLDWELLEQLVYDPGEAKASCLADCNYEILVLNYEEYKERCQR